MLLVQCLSLSNIRVWKVSDGWTELGWRQEAGCDWLDERVKILFIRRRTRPDQQPIDVDEGQVSWGRTGVQRPGDRGHAHSGKTKGWGVEGASTGTKSNQEANSLPKDSSPSKSGYFICPLVKGYKYAHSRILLYVHAHINTLKTLRELGGRLSRENINIINTFQEMPLWIGGSETTKERRVNLRRAGKKINLSVCK